MPPGFHRLMAAQFASALADNALLIVAIALLVEQQMPGWWAPLLKFSFTLSYVLLAPLVGALADAMAKARLMAWMNGVKILGVLALLSGLHPVLAYGIVGLGAAAYAPAKYGLVTELVRPQRLVAANGWIEVSVVCAALLGTVLGGLLVSELARGAAAALQVQAWTFSDSGLALSLLVLLAVYGAASWLNRGIPDSGARYARASTHPARLLRNFWRAHLTLWRDADGGLSLAVTTLFWGIAATLQFAVLRWAQDVLALSLDQAAYLQAGVAVGVVAGAGLAGRCIGLAQAPRVLPVGVALGLLLPAVASCGSLGAALPLLMAAGALGGILVVPMNALLQHRGHQLLSAGQSIAVQGFNENLSVLAMLSVYTALLAFEVPIGLLLWGLGLSISAAIALLLWRQRQRLRTAARAAAP